MFVKIGTYNMSFAGDAGLDPRRPDVYESEAAFHLSNPAFGPGVPVPATVGHRNFWVNAVDNIQSFWNQKDVVISALLGLQEMNLTPSGSMTGSGYVEGICKAINPNLAMETQEIVTPRSRPALSLIWDQDLLGVKAVAKIYSLDYVPTEKAGIAADGSRPILFVFTKTGYILCCLHAPNNDILSRGRHPDMRKGIQDKFTQFLTETGVPFDPRKTFIVGDFNDRYDAINPNDPLIINGYNFTYEGKAPLSCCHNWDSSCSAARYTSLDAIVGRPDVGTCRPPVYPAGTVDAAGSPTDSKGVPWAGQSYKSAGPGPRIPLGEEGILANYKYTGDKVFGLVPASQMILFPALDKDRASQASDHEMVVAVFSIPDGASASAPGPRRNSSRKRMNRKRANRRTRHRRKN